MMAWRSSTRSRAPRPPPLLTEIRARTKLPVRYVVNTHYHLITLAGNGVFADAGAMVVANATCGTGFTPRT